MKRYEIREIEPKEMKRINLYFTNEIEIKTDDYSAVINEKHIGEKVGFEVEGKTRKTWIHPIRTMVQIIDHKTNETITLKDEIQRLEELGRYDFIEKYYK